MFEKDVAWLTITNLAMAAFVAILLIALVVAVADELLRRLRGKDLGWRAHHHVWRVHHHSKH